MKKQAIAFLLALALLGGCAAASVEPGSEPEASAPASTDASSGTSSEAPFQEAMPPVEPPKPEEEPEPPKPLSPFPLGEELIIQTVPSMWKLPETGTDEEFEISAWNLLGLERTVDFAPPEYNSSTVEKPNEANPPAESSDGQADWSSQNYLKRIKNPRTGKTIEIEATYVGTDEIHYRASVEGAVILEIPSIHVRGTPGLYWIDDYRIRGFLFNNLSFLYRLETQDIWYFTYPMERQPLLLPGNEPDWGRGAKGLGYVPAFIPATGEYLISQLGDSDGQSTYGQSAYKRSIYYCNLQTGQQFEVYSGRLALPEAEISSELFMDVLFMGPEELYFLLDNGGPGEGWNFFGETVCAGLYHVSIPTQEVTEIALLEQEDGGRPGREAVLFGSKYMVVSDGAQTQPTGKERLQLVDLTTRTVVFEHTGAYQWVLEDSVLAFADSEFYYLLDINTMTKYAYSLRTLRQRFPGREIHIYYWGVLVETPKAAD